jgi:hypothetical protein
MDRQGTCDPPHASMSVARRNGYAGCPNDPGLLSDLHAQQERFGEHELWRRAWAPVRIPLSMISQSG